MKLYLIEYGWGASTPEKSVILADTPTEALEMAKKGTGEKLILVSGGLRTNMALDYKATECRIVEMPLTKKDIIYTGHYCC